MIDILQTPFFSLLTPLVHFISFPHNFHLYQFIPLLSSHCPRCSSIGFHTEKRKTEETTEQDRTQQEPL